MISVGPDTGTGRFPEDLGGRRWGECSQEARPFYFGSWSQRIPRIKKLSGPSFYMLGSEMRFGDLPETQALRGGLCAVAWSSPATAASVSKGRGRPVPSRFGEVVAAARGLPDLRFSQSLICSGPDSV